MQPQPTSKVRNGLLAIRVSSDKQGRDGDSPEEQRQRGESLAAANNIKVIDMVILVESASHEDQPMQQIVERCKANPNIDIVLIKAIDRFTRGGSSAYIKLKEQLDKLNVSLIDTFGIIDGRRVNTLEHTGFNYYWSTYNPSFKNELLEAERAKDELRDIMTRMIGAEIPLHKARLLDAATTLRLHQRKSKYTKWQATCFNAASGRITLHNAPL